MKTAHVAFLPVVFLSFFFGRLLVLKVNVMFQCTFFYLWPWPWPITGPRYPCKWPPCQNSSLYACPFDWDSETERQTDKQCKNYYTHHVRDVGCKNDKLFNVYWGLSYLPCGSVYSIPSTSSSHASRISLSCRPAMHHQGLAWNIPSILHSKHKFYSNLSKCILKKA